MLMGVKWILMYKAGGSKATTPAAIDGSVIADTLSFPAVGAGCSVPGRPQKTLAWLVLRFWGALGLAPRINENKPSQCASLSPALF